MGLKRAATIPTLVVGRRVRTEDPTDGIEHTHRNDTIDCHVVSNLLSSCFCCPLSIPSYCRYLLSRSVVLVQPLQNSKDLYGGGSNRAVTFMTGWEASTRRYSFGSAVDLPALLNEHHIEFLDVDDTRAVVIFTEAILNVEVDSGSLDHADVVEVAVFEPPADIDPTDQEALSGLIDEFVDRVATWAGTSVTHRD